MAGLTRPENKWKQSSHRLSPLATSVLLLCESLFRIFKNQLHSDSVPCFKQGHRPRPPASFSFSNPSVKNTKNSVCPAHSCFRQGISVSKIISKPGCQGRAVAVLRSPVVRLGPRVQPAGRGGQPPSLSWWTVWACRVETALSPSLLWIWKEICRRGCHLCSIGFSPAPFGADVQVPTPPPRPPTWVSVGRGLTQLLRATLTTGTKPGQVPVPRSGQGACGAGVWDSPPTVGRVWGFGVKCSVFVASQSCELGPRQSVADGPYFRGRKGVCGALTSPDGHFMIS